MSSWAIKLNKWWRRPAPRHEHWTSLKVCQVLSQVDEPSGCFVCVCVCVRVSVSVLLPWILRCSISCPLRISVSKHVCVQDLTSKRRRNEWRLWKGGGVCVRELLSTRGKVTPLHPLLPPCTPPPVQDNAGEGGGGVGWWLTGQGCGWTEHGLSHTWSGRMGCTERTWTSPWSPTRTYILEGPLGARVPGWGWINEIE